MNIHKNSITRYLIFLKNISFMFLLAYSLTGVSASMFQKPEGEVVLFSPMQGKITVNDKPVADARVERFLKWKDETGEKDSFSTDQSGHFNIPVKKDTIKLSTISKFVIAQEVRVYIDKEEYLIWTMGTGNKTSYGELGGKPKTLRCELSDAMTCVEVDDGLLGTSCKWDSIEKQ